MQLAHHLYLIIIFTRSEEHLLIYHFNEKLNPPAFKSPVFLMMCDVFIDGGSVLWVETRSFF